MGRWGRVRDGEAVEKESRRIEGEGDMWGEGEE